MKKSNVRFRRFSNSIFSPFVAVVFILSLAHVSLAEGNKTRVLFVGNSLTSANDLPGTVAELAKSRKIRMEYEAITPGGATFANHASNPAVLKKIKEGNWDFVVLQEQSQMPAMAEPILKSQVYPNAGKLCELVKSANPKASVVFYMTMAQKDGQTFKTDGRSETMSYGQMQDRIAASYREMARDNKALLAPVGLAFKQARGIDPGLALYTDDRHPTVAGTYLAACVFYGVLFKQSPIGLPPLKLSGPIVEFLQRTADQTRS
jgi:hypothetical protein